MMKQLVFYTGLGVLCLGLMCCAPIGANGTPTPDAQTAVGTAIPAATHMPTGLPTLVPAPNTTLPQPTMPSFTSQPLSDVPAALVTLLERAAQEMRAAKKAATLAEAQSHAEATVNLLVGKYGRWYGDRDGDGNRNDPSDGQGVLPGEIHTQGADLDNSPALGTGLALQSARGNLQAAPLLALLGNVNQWSTQPARGYDSIATAVRNANTSPTLDTLQGSVPRAVAFARLILTNAKTIQDAHTFARDAGMELDAAASSAALLPRE